MFKKKLVSKRKAPTGDKIVKTQDGKKVPYYSVKKTEHAYKTKYRLPISQYHRQTLVSKKSIKLAHYEVHHSSNLSRIEYEINKSDELKKVFAPLRDADQYFILQGGFRVQWLTNFGKISITCKYKPDFNREYFITVYDDEVFRRVLDSPVLPINFDEEDDAL